MKQIKHFLLTVAMLLCSTSLFAEDFEVDAIYYNITSEADKTVAVTYQGDYCHSYSNEYSGTVTIPESVTYNGTTYSVTSIGSEAFWNCDDLTSVEIPNSVTSIGSYSFSDCSGLTSVTIPNSVTSIGNKAFSQCYDLISVTIPNSVTSIGEAAFSSCLSLTSIIVDGENTTYDSRDNCNAIIETSSNTLIKGCKSTIIPNSVTSIGSSAFSGSGLTSIEIPNSVTSIGSSAFFNCHGLTSIEIPNSVTSIGEKAFSACNNLTSIIVDDENTTYDSRDNCNAIIETETNELIVGCKSTIIPNSVTSIGNKAFSQCSLTSIEIPNSVTSIGSYAFSDCSGLTSVTIPNSVTSIGEYAFYGCSGLTSVTIPNSVTSLGKGAFHSCYDLTSVTIPNSVTSIDGWTFQNCSGLTSVTIPNSVTSIGIDAFSGCSGLTSIEIPNSVTSIGGSAFSGCSGLTSVTIPNSVTSIDGWTFQNCSGLTSVTIPNSVTRIGLGAFLGCSGLKSITSYIPAEKLLTPQTNCFEGVDKTGCILYVPKGAKEKYATTDGWKDFINIVEILETYKVTFVVDGEVFATDSVTEGNSLVFPNVPEKEGYTFLGWSEAPETMPANDVTITGEYKVNSYAVKYVVDGVGYATDSVAYGSAITLRDEPTKEGYTFLGWSEAPETMPANDVTITGEYKVNSYAVKYIIDGETIATDSVAYGSAITLRDGPTKEGYTFLGWSEAPETMPANDITITGSYKVNTYAVKYVLDNEAYATDSVAYGSAITLRDEPTKEGYTFLGWSEAPETMPANDITINGSFKVNSYAVKYIVDGETITTDSVEYGAVVTLIDELEKEGYSFSWSEAPETMPANDITITGEWSINSYLVTFIVDGEVYATDSVEYGAAITLPEVPEKENSTFEWEEAPKTMPASDLTIYGNYVSGIGGVTISGKADVYTLNGMLYKRDVDLNNLGIELPKGVYIINGKKIMVK